MKEIGIYIHIPFCKKKCYYCDFISYSNKDTYISRYIESLKKEISKCKIKNERIKTIYIGGGTPSYIDAKYIKEILELINNEFKISKNAEITIEINPGTITKEKLKIYKEVGINRLSIGMQSQNDRLLEKIGRIHTFEEFKESFYLARKIGFTNINIDMIIGLPSQNKEDILEMIKVIDNLKPEHISIYSLILEEGTKLHDLVMEKKEILPDDEEERQMYWLIKKEVEKREYNQYEISNFAKKGYESKHNLECWQQNEYLGFGLAAHSYYNNIRFSNTENLKEYIKNIEEEKIENNKIIQEVQNELIKQKEYMLLGLRKIEGVSIRKFQDKFNNTPIKLFKEEIEKLEEQNLIIVSKDNIKLTNRGIDLANIVWQEFV